MLVEQLSVVVAGHWTHYGRSAYLYQTCRVSVLWSIFGRLGLRYFVVASEWVDGCNQYWDYWCLHVSSSDSGGEDVQDVILLSCFILGKLYPSRLLVDLLHKCVFFIRHYPQTTTSESNNENKRASSGIPSYCYRFSNSICWAGSLVKALKWERRAVCLADGNDVLMMMDVEHCVYRDVAVILSIFFFEINVRLFTP